MIPVLSLRRKALTPHVPRAIALTVTQQMLLQSGCT